MKFTESLIEICRRFLKKISINKFILIIILQILIILISFIIFIVTTFTILPYFEIIFAIWFTPYSQEIIKGKRKFKREINQLYYIYELFNSNRLKYFRIVNKIYDIGRVFIEVLEFSCDVPLEQINQDHSIVFENNHFVLSFYNRIPQKLNTQATPIFNSLIKNFEFVFKGRSEFNNSVSEMIEYLKNNLNNQIPVLVSFEAGGGAHIRTLIEYTVNELLFFDPGDCLLKRFNYINDQFQNALRVDLHTLVIKPR